MCVIRVLYRLTTLAAFRLEHIANVWRAANEENIEQWNAINFKGLLKHKTLKCSSLISLRDQRPISINIGLLWRNPTPTEIFLLLGSWASIPAHELSIFVKVFQCDLICSIHYFYYAIHLKLNVRITSAPIPIEHDTRSSAKCF